MRQRVPMRTRPSSTAWAPISVPSAIRTSGPITEYGPTRTPAASSARASITAVGWIMSVAALPFELTNALLKRAHLREHGFRRPDASGLGARPARDAAPDLARRDVARHTGLGRENRPLANRYVVGDTYLPRQDRPVADPAGAGNADLGDQDHVLADLAVMPDLHQVVDLRAPADHRVAERPPIDGAVGPDFHVSVDPQAAHLGDFAMGRAVERIAESVGAQHGSGVHDHAVPDADAVPDDDPGVEPHLITECRVHPDKTERSDAAAGADHRPALDHSMRADCRGGIHPRAGRDDGRPVDARRRRGLGMKQTEQRNQCGLW